MQVILKLDNHVQQVCLKLQYERIQEMYNHIINITKEGNNYIKRPDKQLSALIKYEQKQNYLGEITCIMYANELLSKQEYFLSSHKNTILYLLYLLTFFIMAFIFTIILLPFVANKQCKVVLSPSCSVCSTNKILTSCQYFTSQYGSSALKYVTLTVIDCMRICCANFEFNTPAEQFDVESCKANSPKQKLSSLIIGVSLGASLLFCILLLVAWSIVRHFIDRKNMERIEWQIQIGGGMNKADNICSICLLQRPELSTQCLHNFHLECICQWLHYKEYCPVCRTQKMKNCFLYCKNCLQSKSKLNILEISKKRLEKIKKSKERELCENCRLEKTGKANAIMTDQRFDFGCKQP